MSASPETDETNASPVSDCVTAEDRRREERFLQKLHFLRWLYAQPDRSAMALTEDQRREINGWDVFIEQLEMRKTESLVEI